jgi:hypothetical protein
MQDILAAALEFASQNKTEISSYAHLNAILSLSLPPLLSIFYLSS